MNFALNLQEETVEHVEWQPAVIVSPDLAVREVMETMKHERAGSVMICESNKLVGILTERDALRLMAREDKYDTAVSNYMIKKPVCLHKDDAVSEAIGKMSTGRYRHLPVVDDNHAPLGVLEVAGILRYLVEHFPNVVYTLPPEPSTVSATREGA